MSTNPKLEDVEYQIFWREIQEAVKQVELNHGLSYTIERGTKSASVRWCWDHDKEQQQRVEIRIYEVEPKQPTLLVP